MTDRFFNLDDAPFVVTDVGRMRYAPALAMQRERQAEVIAVRESSPVMHLLLVEHAPPVITVSRRKGAADHLLASRAQLAAAGVEVEATDRGGDITYHGPGQLVVYPIFDLNRLGLRLHSYMRFLEGIVIDVLGEFGIEGQRDDDATGVWVDGARKICAMGVRVSRWVSMHGLAINVSVNLDHFDLIVPCGLVGRAVTSMDVERPESPPSMEDVKAAMVARFRSACIEQMDRAASSGT